MTTPASALGVTAAQHAQLDELYGPDGVRLLQRLYDHLRFLLGDDQAIHTWLRQLHPQLGGAPLDLLLEGELLRVLWWLEGLSDT